MVPLQARRLRLHLASGEDTRYLQEVLDRTSVRFGCRVSLAENGLLALVPAGRTTGGTGPA
jgi:poly-gamma-glutamate synthesis protein (capsule biosynthesis protein)